MRAAHSTRALRLVAQGMLCSTCSVLEQLSPCDQVSFPNHNRISGNRRCQRHWVASAGSTDRLGINRGGAILAHDTAWRLKKSDRTANFAGIEHRDDSSIGLLIQQKADFSPVLENRVAMQIAIRNLSQRDRDRAIIESYLGRRRQGVNALCVNEFSRNHHDKQE